MIARRVVFAPRAETQIGDIWDYIALHSDENTADRIVDALIERCLELDMFPGRGTPHEELGEGVRTIPFRRTATIGYVIAGADVVVTGIAWRGQKLEEAIRVPSQRG